MNLYTDKVQSKILNLLNRLENNKILTAIRNGMIYAIPVFIFGAFCLVVRDFPVSGYSEWISSAANGWILFILNAVNRVTMGIASPLLVITISYSYSKLMKERNAGHLPFCITAFIVFIAFIRIDSDQIIPKDFTVSGIFSAIILTVASCIAYERIFILLGNLKSRKHPYLGDLNFNNAILSIAPIITTVMLFILLRIVMYYLGITSISSSQLQMLEKIFGTGSRTFFHGLLYVTISTLLWFFGIHGSDVLENVALEHFTEINSSIFSKTFVDTFVLTGGCGTALCLALSILIFSRVKINRRLARMSVLPALFNVSEPLIFGIPVVFNPILFIPFLLTPVICYITSYAATFLGIVPVITSQVTWTTPVFISGYAATGSISGSFLQLFNLLLGVIIYSYFVRVNEKLQVRRYTEAVRKMQQQLDNDIEKSIPTNLIDSSYSRYAAMLMSDVYNSLEKNKLEMYYQPQVSAEGRCYGAEALLRYESNECGHVPIPLLLQVALEGGFLPMIEEYIVNHVFSFVSTLEEDMLISFNVTARFISRPEFIGIIDRLQRHYDVSASNIAIEITEEMAFSSPRIVLENVQKLHERGYQVILDDFGMGHSSLMYINDYSFNNVKITGELVLDAAYSENSRQIIKAIVHLGHKSNYTVTAEFVENKEMQDLLIELGCHCFQGYYYSRAISGEDFIGWSQNHNHK